MDLELNEIKEYIRVDTDDDDEVLKSLKLSAEEYLKNSGISVDYSNNLYCTAIKMLIANWYDTRDSIGGKDTISAMFKSIITQLSLSGGDIK